MTQTPTPSLKSTLVRQARRALPPLFYALLVLFLVLYLHGIDWSKLHGLRLNWGFIIIATVIGVSDRFWQVLVWIVLLHRLGARNLVSHWRQLTYVYAKSWMGRYIPGTAPWILGKIYFASRHGIPRAKLAVSSLLEGALEIVVLLALSFTMLLFDSRFSVINSATRWFMGIAIAACVVAMAPPVFNRLVSIGYRLMRHKSLEREHLVTNKTILSGAGLYVIGSLMSGIAFFFIAKSIYHPLAYHDLPFLIGASNLAGALGMLAIFAPSGIGVREGVLLVLLGTLMPKSVAVVIVVVSRLWGVAADFVYFGLARAIAGRSVAQSTDAEGAAAKRELEHERA
jgi:uncharacterized membrane protein YbhN (UPF0104 family)